MKVQISFRFLSICLWFLISCKEISSQGCLPYILDVSLQERLQRSEVVLYGTDITPKGNDTACLTNPGSCGRRVIKFKVKCVLKASYFSIPAEITIGARETHNECDATLFGYEERDQDYVVLLKNPSQDEFDWDEVAGKSGKLIFNDQVMEDVKETCGVTRWEPPHEVKENLCPEIDDRPDHCAKTCQKEWNNIDGKCIYISSEETGTLDEAISYCQKMASSLVSLSEEELLKVQNVIRGKTDRWWMRQLSDENDAKESSGNETMPTGYQYMSVGATSLREASGDNETHGYMCGKEAAPFYPLLPDKGSEITVNISLTKMRGQVCCRQFYNRPRTFSISSNPSQMINSKDLIDPPVSIEYKGLKDSYLYTAILADISGPGHSKGTRYAPYIHMMVVNIPVQENYILNLTSGDIAVNYSAPVPTYEDQEPFVFIIYKQGIEIDEKEIKKVNSDVYSGKECKPRTRCLFQIKLWEQAWKLTNEAGLSFGVAVDEYAVDQLMRSMPLSEKETCLHFWPETKLTYGVVACKSGPRKSSGASALYSSMSLSILAINLFYFLN